MFNHIKMCQSQVSEGQSRTTRLQWQVIQVMSPAAWDELLLLKYI